MPSDPMPRALSWPWLSRGSCQCNGVSLRPVPLTATTGAKELFAQRKYRRPDIIIISRLESFFIFHALFFTTVVLYMGHVYP
jgi:hypothetical protein